MSEKVITENDLQDHKSKHSIWITVNGKVYDATPFQTEHPGGDMVLLEYGGRDATETFINLPHSEDAKKILESMYIGELDEKTKLKYEANHIADDIKAEYNPIPPRTPGVFDSIFNGMLKYLPFLVMLGLVYFYFIK